MGVVKRIGSTFVFCFYLCLKQILNGPQIGTGGKKGRDPIVSEQRIPTLFFAPDSPAPEKFAVTCHVPKHFRCPSSKRQRLWLVSGFKRRAPVCLVAPASGSLGSASKSVSRSDSAQGVY